jgi:hypothetical protein
MQNRQYITICNGCPCVCVWAYKLLISKLTPVSAVKIRSVKKILQFTSIFMTCAMVVERRASSVSRSEGARATHSAFPLLQMIGLNYVCVNSLTGCPVLEFIDPVLSLKTSVFIKTSLKFSFSIQTLLNAQRHYFQLVLWVVSENIRCVDEGKGFLPELRQNFLIFSIS